jgi:outer membrane immunogenic protein
MVAVSGISFLILEITMRQILIGSIAIASLAATGAFAADLPARTYTKAPVMVDPGYNWTGFYAGLNGGYSWGRGSETAPIGAPFPATASYTSTQNVNGGVFGGQIGYNWQVDRKWVLGLEADGQWTGERGRANNNLGSIDIPTPGDDFNLLSTGSVSNETKLPWFATFRGRAGFLADPSLLLYATGGLAVGQVTYSSQATLTAQLFGPGIAGTTPASPLLTLVGPALSESQTRVGWTLGAGAEKKFTPNWSAKLEYLYMDFGKTTYFSGTANAIDVNFHDHIFRAGINYAFSPAAVVAKY